MNIRAVRIEFSALSSIYTYRTGSHEKKEYHVT